MPRAVPEWIGKDDNEAPPPRVKTRLLRKFNFRCALSGAEIHPGNQHELQWDHIIALINNGANRESNLQPVLRAEHKKKTKLDVAIKAQTEAMTKSAFRLNTEPKRKMQGRPFPKSTKPRLFDKTALAPRQIFKDVKI